ncbi:uncharacterized protein LOC141905524 isoform X2 [Tubulanus polymorphus]|uniref:uncharacterized protein LOC141905524 isoform X2 n=1 Tax=Tubulanus polymorphus TaxID=672921 RepID=UPI003DA23BFD
MEGGLSPFDRREFVSKPFRLNVNDRESQILKKELDNVARKTIGEIQLALKEKKKNAATTDNVTNKIREEFKTPKKIKKRKRDPIIPFPPKPHNVQVKPDAYNPLEKGPDAKLPGTDELKKSYPNLNKDQTTIEELKKPKVTSVGVHPSRSSTKIDDLKVFMQGQSAISKDDIAIGEINKANSTLAYLTPMSSSPKLDLATIPSKPAILPQAGTIAAVPVAERQKPPSRPISGFTRKSTAKRSKVGISEVDLAKLDQNVEDKKPDDQKSYVSSGSSVKSSKELLEEAKALTSGKRSHSSKKHSISSQSGRDGAKGKGSSKEKQSTKSEPVPALKSEGRSVDDIISSLKTQDTHVMSESDRKIKEIMDRVMTRAPSTPYDESSDKHTEEGLTSEQQQDEQDEETEIEIEQAKTPEEDEAAEQETQASEDALAKTFAEIRKEVEQQETEKKAEELRIQQAEEEEMLRKRSEMEQILRDFELPVDVTHEDLVSIAGEKQVLHQRQEPPKLDSIDEEDASAEESSKIPVEETGRDFTSFHHFCSVSSEYQLPKELQGVMRKHITQAKYETVQAFNKRAEDFMGPEVMIEDETAVHAVPSESEDERNRRLSQAAAWILNEAELLGKQDRYSYDELKSTAEELIQTDELTIEGMQVKLKNDESRFYWTPAPAKLDVAPARVKMHLFPAYQSSMRPSRRLTDIDADESDESLTDDEFYEAPQMTSRDATIVNRILTRTYHSCEDLTNLMIMKLENLKSDQQKSEEESTLTYPTTARSISTVKTAQKSEQTFGSSVSEAATDIQVSTAPRMSFAEMRKWFVEATAVQTTSTVEESDTATARTETTVSIPFIKPIRRAKSLPNIQPEEDVLVIQQDFAVAVTELDKQRELIQKVAEERKAEEENQAQDENEEETEDASMDSTQMTNTATESIETTYESPFKSLFTRDLKKTAAELAVEAGRAYVIIPKPKKKKKQIDMARIEAIEKFIEQEPNRLERSKSLENVKHVVERQLRVPFHVRSRRRNSVTNLDFEGFVEEKGGITSSSENEREWVRDIWNEWFDEVFPPESESDDEVADAGQQFAATLAEDAAKKSTDKNNEQTVSARYDISLIDEIEPLVEGVDSQEIIQMLSEEVEKLTAVIESSDSSRPFDLCRRGAILRKLGFLKQAQNDLDLAIELEPMLLDAYWHRHLLFLLYDKITPALEDLNFLIKQNKSHAGAYRSRAEIFRRSNDMTMAIINYTQAIKLNPTDHEAYFKRAEMYEQRGEMLLALEDYNRCHKLMPTRTDALLKHAKYHFDNRNWAACISSFTDLLNISPDSAEGRTYRGLAYAKVKQWNSAVSDLSKAIHLNPDNSLAFYHRGCLLRTSHPKRALLDLSISILIDDSEDNLLAYLHRGILYNEMGRWEDAIPDFEAVLKLNKDIACAHVNLGLIYYQLESYHRAVKRFTAAIKVDPTYVRAYVCRAEAYTRVHDVKNALLDFTRAIHLRPDVPDYYMYRGYLVLKLGNLDLAAFCVQHAAELNVGLGQSPTQQAVVLSFLKQYDKAIEALQFAARQKPIAPHYFLLGKTEMKDKRFNDAVNSFQQALSVLKPWTERIPWPKEAAEAYFLIGKCYCEMKNHFEALDAFNNALKVNPKYANAYYQRGLMKMKLKQSKGIQDFNRALAIDPTIFQAYLSRAAYYGMKGQYSKAILNCNEAIRMQRKSVRAYLYRGALKYHIKAYELAIQDLTMATNLDSSCAMAYFNRAVCYHDSKDYGKALVDYGIVLLLDSDMILRVLINRGLLYFENGDYNNALYDFDYACKLQPKDVHLYHTLGLCYHKLGRLEEAIRAFTKAIELEQFFLDAYMGRGNAFLDFGTRTGVACARHDYERCIKLDPLYLPARVNLAYSLEMTGQFMQAWTQFTIAININPKYQPAFEGRAVINLQMRDTFAALQDINASLAVLGTAEIYTNRGVIYQFTEDPVNAMRDYQRAITIDPTYSLAYFNAANIYFHMRQFKQAERYYNKALQFNPKDEGAFLNRAITRTFLRDYEGAMKDFICAVQLMPMSSHVYLNRGNLYSSLQQYDKAEQDFTKALSIQPDDPVVYMRRADVRGKQGLKEIAIKDYRKALKIKARMRALKLNQMKGDLT